MKRYLLAALLAACAPATVAPTSAPTLTPTATATTGSSPTGTSSPTAAPTPSPTFSTRTPRPVPSATPATLVLSMERWTDIPVPGPQRFVTSDGRMVWLEGAYGDSQRYRTQRLAQRGVDALRDAALATGLFTTDRQLVPSPRPGVTIPGRGFDAVTIALRTGDRLVRVSGVLTAEPEFYQPSAEREALRALALRLEDVGWLPAGALAESQSRDYLATHYRLMLIPSPGVPSTAPHAATVWPFGDPSSFGVGVPLGVPGYPPLRCAVVDANDARMVAESLIAGRAATHFDPAAPLFRAGMGWPEFSGEYQVQMSPLLPHESLRCEGAQPRI